MARVHIGLPTYNGVEFIEECLSSLQNQTFQDFEVIISDNASTDGTSDLCADFARRDARFRHIRASSTIPAGENFTKVLELSAAPYFLWRADDDLAEPDHLRGLVAALDSSPDAGLAVAPIHRLTFSPRYSEQIFELPTISSPLELIRIRETILGCHPSWFYGLWRREIALRDWKMTVEDYPYLWASDHLALLPSLLSGQVVLVPESKFIQRIFRTPTYRLAQEDRLAARRLYSKLAAKMVAELNLNVAERKWMEKTVERHVELAVAPLLKTYKRLLLKKVFKLLNLSSKRYD